MSCCHGTPDNRGQTGRLPKFNGAHTPHTPISPSARSVPTGPVTRGAATPPSRRAAPVPSYRHARTRGHGWRPRLAHRPGTESFAPPAALAARSGGAGAAATDKAWSRPKCDASSCSGSAPWPRLRQASGRATDPSGDPESLHCPRNTANSTRGMTPSNGGGNLPSR